MSFSSPNSTWTVQNSPDNVDTHLQSKTVPHLQWIQRPSIVLLLLIVLAFKSQHCMATEKSENAASSCSTARKHITLPTGSIPEPPYARHAVVVSTVFTLEGFHCNHKICCEEVTVGCFWDIYVGLCLISILFAMWSHKKSWICDYCLHWKTCVSIGYFHCTHTGIVN